LSMDGYSREMAGVCAGKCTILHFPCEREG
jgi:hypothetical protein